MSTFEVKRYSRPKPPTPGTCGACTHFSKGYRKRVSGYCMKHGSSTKSNSACVFYKECLTVTKNR